MRISPTPSGWNLDPRPLTGVDREWAEEFGLNHPQMRFVQEAVPGSDRKGYSNALLGVDGEWRGIEVRALPTEKAVIDYAPRSAQSVTDSLPSSVRHQSGDSETAADD